MQSTRMFIKERFSEILVGTTVVVVGFLSSVAHEPRNVYLSLLIGFLVSTGIINLDEHSRRMNTQNEGIQKNFPSTGLLSILLSGIMVSVTNIISVACFSATILLAASYFRLKYRSIVAPVLRSMIIGMFVILGASLGGITLLTLILALFASILFFAAEVTWEIGTGHEKYRTVSIPAYFGERESGMLVSALMFVCMLLMLFLIKVFPGIHVYGISVPAIIFAYCGYKMLLDAEKFAREVYFLEKVGALIAMVTILCPKILIVFG